MDERGGEQVLDAEVQVVLPTLRETEAHMLTKALLDGHCKPKQRTTQHNLELEVCQNACMTNCWVMSMFQPRLNGSRDFLIPAYSITSSMSCIWGEVGGLCNRDVQPFLIGDNNNMKKRWLRAPRQFPTVARWWTSWKKHTSARNSGWFPDFARTAPSEIRCASSKEFRMVVNRGSVKMLRKAEAHDQPLRSQPGLSAKVSISSVGCCSGVRNTSPTKVLCV